MLEQRLAELSGETLALQLPVCLLAQLAVEAGADPARMRQRADRWHDIEAKRMRAVDDAAFTDSIRLFLGVTDIAAQRR